MATASTRLFWPSYPNAFYKAIAAQELAGVNRGELVVYLLNGAIGMFTRMVAMMGFENALIALFEDPESCNEFGEAFADYELKRVNKIIDAYQPDVMWFADDLAHARGLFMSTDTYYSVIRPHNKRIIEQITSRGVIVDFHCCGKCDAIVPDFVEMGCRIWNPAQVMNDLEGIQKKYGSRLIIEGGWNSQGRPSCVDATEQEICDEVERTIITYGGYGNYIMLPFIFNKQGNALFLEDSRKQGMFATYQRLCRLS